MDLRSIGWRPGAVAAESGRGRRLRGRRRSISRSWIVEVASGAARGRSRPASVVARSTRSPPIVDGGDAGQRGERDGVGPRRAEPDRPAAIEALLIDGGRAVGDDPAVVEDDDPVGDLVGLLEVVGGEQDRPALGREAPACRPRTPAGSRRPSPRSARRGRRRSGSPAIADREPDALRLAAGQRLRPAGRPSAVRPGPAGRRRRQRVGSRGARISSISSPTRAKRRQAGSPGASRRSGRRGRRRAAAIRGRATEPARRLEQAEHQADRGRLAGAVRAEQGDGLAGARSRGRSRRARRSARRSGSTPRKSTATATDLRIASGAGVGAAWLAVSGSVTVGTVMRVSRIRSVVVRPSSPRCRLAPSHGRRERGVTLDRRRP